jgi:hypothetical protein
VPLFVRTPPLSFLGLACSYEGMWQADKQHGRGRFVAANGDSYNGEWRLNVRHGTGSSCSWTTGEEKYGQWANGAFVKELEVLNHILCSCPLPPPPIRC